MKKNINIITLSLALLLSGRAYSTEWDTAETTTSDVWGDDKVGLSALFEEDDDIEVDDDFETDSVDSLAGLSEDEQLAAIDGVVREAMTTDNIVKTQEKLNSLLETSDLGRAVISEKYYDLIKDDNDYEKIVQFIDSL